MKRGETVPQVVAQFQQKSWRRIGGQELNIDNATIGKRASSLRRLRTSHLQLIQTWSKLELARKCAFLDVAHVSAAALAEHFFMGRTDGMRPSYNCEEFVMAKT
jgi:hypothetical protein